MEYMRWRCQYAVGGGPSFGRRPHFSFPPPLHKGVMQVVTYSDLIQIGILVVSIISLVLQINPDRKEITAHSSPANDYFC